MNGGNGATDASARRDVLFRRIVVLSFTVVAIYTIGMFVVIIFGEDEALSLRMLNIFPGVLASVIALCTGYLLGHTNATHCDCPSCEAARIMAAEKLLPEVPKADD